MTGQTPHSVLRSLTQARLADLARDLGASLPAGRKDLQVAKLHRSYAATATAWEVDLGARVLDARTEQLGEIDRLDLLHRFGAGYNALRWNRVTATDARLFQAPFRARAHCRGALHARNRCPKPAAASRPKSTARKARAAKNQTSMLDED